MIAYKGFNKNLACTLGSGIFQYEIGKTYTESEAKCANTGFHCVEEPIEVRCWYSEPGSRYCIVKASGDVNEDGSDKISCTEMTILKEISLQQLGALECKWIVEHPERKNSSKVKKDVGNAEKNDIVIVRGRNPKAAGKMGSTIYLVKGSKKAIEMVGIYEIDDVEHLPDVYYRADGRRAR